MTRQPCPKCGEYSMSGPRYMRNAFGERLRYDCGTCGFHKTTPTADADKSIPSVSEMIRQALGAKESK